MLTHSVSLEVRVMLKATVGFYTASIYFVLFKSRAVMLPKFTAALSFQIISGLIYFQNVM